MPCTTCPTTHPCPRCSGTGTTSEPCPSCFGKRGFFEMEGGGDEARGEFHAPCISMQCRSCDGEGIAFERCRECVGVGYLRVYCGRCEEEFRQYQYRGRDGDRVEEREMNEKGTDIGDFPCMQLRKHRGAEWWDERMDEYRDTEEVETFVTNKLDDLAAYEKVEDKVEHYKALMDSKEMTTEDFIYTVSTLLSSS
ncbi:hypothetical protein Aspvir_003486 [Aspergillus viridinutans]|uniref:Uncharacterized protein n=1 Tax=Aspergillus viridinutans TaxID=75553 RepID=A0A9P3C823_ASPVI|nr:uncharacterized protein Aspvir_003486 [Aspergillus viridinutans]GIK07817.1 hypothetical protein Aspvir_003486 [Aspergillus viridinutans]